MAHATGVGLGAGGVGLIAGESIQQSAERGVIGQRAADFTALGTSGTALWLAVARELDIIALSPATTAGLAGFGIGNIGWYAARRGGIAPRLVADIPQEVNLAGPIVGAFVFTAIGVGLATATRAIR